MALISILCVVHTSQAVVGTECCLNEMKKNSSGEKKFRKVLKIFMPAACYLL